MAFLQGVPQLCSTAGERAAPLAFVALWESRACPFSRRVLHRTMTSAYPQLVAVCVVLEGWLSLLQSWCGSAGQCSGVQGLCALQSNAVQCSEPMLLQLSVCPVHSSSSRWEKRTPSRSRGQTPRRRPHIHIHIHKRPQERDYVLKILFLFSIHFII